MQDVLNYIAEHHDQHLKNLADFLAIPSVSTDKQQVPDVAHCADWLADYLRGIGLNNVVTEATAGHPIVYGEWLEAGPDKPTVLFYGHYDVQPVDPIDLWTQPPFEPTIRDGKIYARGATDDKGQVFLHIAALESHLKTNGTLPVNVKVLIEGEEEIGSPNLTPFLEQHRERLACDTVVISDTAMYAPEMPSIGYGLRGLAYMEVTVQGPNRDLHSGSFGGAVANPANVLAAIITRLKDDFGRITVPGFYDDVLPLSEEERAEFARLPWSEEKYCAELNIPHSYGEFGYTTLERLWARPTLDVNGMWSGFTGEGAKTVLPAKASAKISMRLVPNQDWRDISEKFENYVRAIAPPTVQVEVTSHHGGNPVLTPVDSPGVQAAMRALEQAYGVKPYLKREGGSIPIVLTFQQILAAPVVLMGFGLETENLHSPDEHFDLSNFRRGIEATACFYAEL